MIPKTPSTPKKQKEQKKLSKPDNKVPFKYL